MVKPKASEVTPGRDWTEGQFQSWVVDVAKEKGWRVHVTLKRMRKASIVADPDWPDLEMLRGPRLVFAELKAESGRLTDGQRKVLEMLNVAGQEVYLWTPGLHPIIRSLLEEGGDEMNIFPKQFIAPS